MVSKLECAGIGWPDWTVSLSHSYLLNEIRFYIETCAIRKLSISAFIWCKNHNDRTRIDLCTDQNIHIPISQFPNIALDHFWRNSGLPFCPHQKTRHFSFLKEFWVLKWSRNWNVPGLGDQTGPFHCLTHISLTKSDFTSRPVPFES